MIERFTKIFSVAFAVLWAIVIFVEYWQYNPYYGQAFSYFQYLDLLVVFLLLGVALSWGLAKTKEKKTNLKWLNGAVIFGGLLLLDAITIGLFYSKINSISLNAVGLFSHLGHFIGVAFCVYLIYLVCRVLGTSLTMVFPPKTAKADLPVIQTALGLIFLTFLLFVLGTFHLLYIFIIAPLLMCVLVFNWNMTIGFIKNSLLKPIKISSEFNALGVFSFLFLAAFLAFDFAQILRPFPMGTDSINLYVNLPSLIADYAGLVDGNQPYNWSLFMSLGLVVFNRVDVVLALSFFGGLMSLFALFRLGRKWLNVNYAALCLLLFFSVPMINFLSHMDMKIDLGLLFMMLCVLILFVNWVKPPDLTKKAAVKTALVKTKRSKQFKQGPGKIKKASTPAYLLRAKAFFAARTPAILIENRLIVLMGIFTGFCFGIKLSSLFIFFALITSIWYTVGGKWAFLSALFLVLGTVFLFEMDEQAMLRDFHKNVFILQWLLLAIGLGLLVYWGMGQKAKAMRLIRLSTLLSLFFLLPMIPWFGKNLVETKSFSTEALLNGKRAAPQMNIYELNKKWEARRKEKK